MSILVIIIILAAVLTSGEEATAQRLQTSSPTAGTTQLQINSRTVRPGNSISGFKLARVKYSGGGDWYNDPSAEVNLLRFVRANTGMHVDPVYEFVDLGTDNVFIYPMLFMTGHGTVNLTETEVRNLRAYLEQGGFLYIDDDYGMDESMRRELRRVLPNQELRELPFDHPIYHSHFSFPSGLPKIHEHDAKAPQGFGLFIDGRLCVFYTVETNPSDGWADPEVHHDPPEKRESALRIGTNIIVYALSR